MKRRLKLINPVADVSLLTISLITQGFQLPMWKRYVGDYLEDTFSVYENNFLSWYVDWPLWQRFGKSLFVKIVRSRAFSQQIYQKHKAISRQLYRHSDLILTKDHVKLTNQQIATILRTLFKSFRDLCGWGIPIVMIDFENNFLSGWLEKKIIGQAEQYQVRISPQELMSVLTTPLELSFSQQEKVDRWKLAGQTVISPAAVRRHHDRYCWVEYGYIGPAHTVAYYKKIIQLLRQRRISPHAELKKMDTERAQLVQQQRQFTRLLHLDRQTQYLLATARRFMFLKMYRKEILFKVFYAVDQLFKEFTRRFGYSHDELHYCLPDEILGILHGKKVAQKEIKRRQKHYFVHAYLRGKDYLYYGKQAQGIIKRNLFQEKIDTSVHEVKGMSAYLGLARGRAVIVNTVADMSKVRLGDVLISIATSPNILPAMAKASAFVTDTGGITCHAAIVAREMKKPCVIGTKIATKVFQDGGWVEVDANNGLVRKAR